MYKFFMQYKNMKKVVKILLIFLVILNIFMVASEVFGISYNNYKPSNPGSSTRVEKIAGNALSIVRNVGVAVGVVTLTIIGIKYMIGSVEEKAEYKKTLVPFLIGAILLIAGTTMVKVIYDFASGL